MGDSIDSNFAADIAAVQRIDAVRVILDEVCRLTGMGFAAVSRVTDTEWIACQVRDTVGFGMDVGDELEIGTTICGEVRASGQSVVIDDVSEEPIWRTHPTPIMYGFQSYLSVPILLPDGSFFGTLCALDPEARPVRLRGAVATIEDFARQIGSALGARLPS